MSKAYELAKKGEGFTSPNPCVGAVIVKNGKIIGEGWHKKAGQDHAEIMAIKSAKSSVEGADLYVTLEPCCHVGKTGPCTEAIIKAGIKNVFIGMKDPFMNVNGKGIKILGKNGIKVEVLNSKSELAINIRKINQPFLKWASNGLPYLTLKAGMSLDGKIATSARESKWITGEKSREDAYVERGKYDAIIVGAGTVSADDPELQNHGQYKAKKILRIVVDENLDLGLKYKVFKDKNVLVVCTNDASEKNKNKFIKAGIDFKSFGKKMSVGKLLKFLAERDVQSIIVEGGSQTHGMFYDAALNDKNLLDKVLFYIAPKIIGGENALPVIGGSGIKKLSEAREALEIEVEAGKTGKDLKYMAVFNRY